MAGRCLHHCYELWHMYGATKLNQKNICRSVTFVRKTGIVPCRTKGWYADDGILKEISAKCSPVDSAADKRIYSAVCKKCCETPVDKYCSDYEYKVEGVDRYMVSK